MKLLAVGLILCSLFSSMSSGNMPDIQIKPEDSGYLLQSITMENGIYKQDALFKEPVTHTKIVSTLGSLKSKTSLNSGFRVDSSIKSNEVDVESLSGHLVTKEVKEDDPRLHFLCHVAQDKSRFAKSYQEFQSRKDKLSSKAGAPLNSNYCCVFSVVSSLSTQTVGCKLDPAKGPICQASAVLNKALWNMQPLGSINISYIIEPTNSYDARSCLENDYDLSSFTKLNSPKLKRISSDKEHEISRTILVQVPTRELKIEEVFRIPLKLKNASNLLGFVLRLTIESKTYVQFVGVNIHLNDYWSVDHKSEMKGGINVTEITANLREDTMSSSNPSHVKYLFELQFRVLPLPTKSGSRRLAPRMFWSLVSSRKRDSPHSTIFRDSPSPTRLKIQSSFYQDIVAVIKSKNILNKAPLTGDSQIHRIWVYALRYDLTLHEVTSQANCHSDKPNLVKFAKTRCMRINVSPESKAISGLVQLIVKFETLNDQLLIRVWSPELPLKMELTRSVLHPIRGWAKQGEANQQNDYRNFQYDSGYTWYQDRFNHRMPNDVDPSKTPPNRSCQLRYQRAKISVYARFTHMTRPSYDNDYFGGSPDAYIDVTDTVLSRIRVVHRGMRPCARLIDEQWLEGLRPGTVRVLIDRPNIYSDSSSDSYDYMASTTVNVTDKPVDITELKADLITELSLSATRVASPTYSISNQRPSLPSQTPAMPKLQRYQLSLFPSWSGKIRNRDYPASLIVAMKFSDGSVEHLSRQSSDSLGIQVTNLKPQFIELRSTETYWTVYRSENLEPNKQSSGDIVKVTLTSVSPDCMNQQPFLPRPVLIFASILPANFHRWSTQPLDEGFTKTKNNPNAGIIVSRNDTARSKESNARPDRPDPIDYKEVPNNSYRHLTFPKQRHQPPSSNIIDSDREQLMPNAKLHPVPHNNDRNDNSPSKHSIKSKVEKKPINLSDNSRSNEPVSSIRDSQSMSSLKIGMYAILAVFCAAALIFAVNCGAMIARYKRYRTCPRPTTGQQVIATKDNNWVWMGHETLKRNSLHTRCTELLLPTDKFSSSFHQNGATVTPVSPSANNARFSSSSEATSGDTSHGREQPADSREENIPLFESVRPNQSGGPPHSRKGNKQYTGQECSIRILTNPVSDEAADNLAANMIHSYNSNSSQRRKHRRQQLNSGNGIAAPSINAAKSPSSFSDHHHPSRRIHNRHSPPSFPPPAQPPPPIPANHGRSAGLPPPADDLRSRHARSMCVSKAMTSSNHSSATSSLHHTDEMPPVPPVRTTSRHCTPVAHQPDILLQYHHSKLGLIRPLSQPGTGHMPEMLVRPGDRIMMAHHIPGPNKFSASSMLYAPPTDTSMDIDWQDEIRGMSYDQLMFYFSNLKESTA